MSSNAITIGCDPEYFVVDKEGKPVPSVGLVPGTKDKPHDLGDGLAVHEDCVVVEITTPPATSAWQLYDYVADARDRVYEQFLKDKELLLMVSAAQTFTSKQLDSEQAMTFGCEPDFDAYEAGKVRGKPPRALTTGPVRFAGHHVHIGGKFNCPPFVVALFADVEMFLKAIYQGYELPPKNNLLRAEWYGKPGIYREKSYGIEYRSLPPCFFSNEDAATQMYSNAIDCASLASNRTADDLREIVRQMPWTEIRDFLTNGVYKGTHRDRFNKAEELMVRCNRIKEKVA